MEIKHKNSTSFINQKHSTVDCLIISIGRSASTAIYQYLNEACALNLPDNKEPHHWCNVEQYPGRYDLINQLYVKNRRDYFESYFSAKKVVDASVGYFYYIEDVIANLKEANQMPKVVFLYREPFSRATSLFNELKKKKLTNTDRVDIEITLEKEKGLWWENYFDNVSYFDNYKSMELYFDEILTVNYDAFNSNPQEVLSLISDFLGVKICKQINYVPVNSSAEANVISEINKFDRILRVIRADLLPQRAKDLIKDYMVKLYGLKKNSDINDLEYSLPFSVNQYEKFQNYINKEKILCSKK